MQLITIAMYLTPTLLPTHAVLIDHFRSTLIIKSSAIKNNLLAIKVYWYRLVGVRSFVTPKVGVVPEALSLKPHSLI